MKVLFPSFIILLVITFSSCGSADSTVPKPSGPEEQAAETTVVEPAEEDLPSGERALADDEIREFGLITEIEDGGYPFYSVTVEFPEREMTISFRLNVEAIDQDASELEAFRNKYATIYYTSELENNLLDLKVKGVSMVNDEALEVGPEWKTVTGTLKGAEAATAGDLPDVISVVDKTGNAIYFETYITEETVAVNGSEVTAVYAVQGVSIITYLQASE